MNSENDESKIQAIIKVGYRYKYIHVQCSMDTQKKCTPKTREECHTPAEE